MLEQVQRSEISNPPAYGAKIASKILNDPNLYAMWQQDLVTMSSRIRQMRHALFDHLQAYGEYMLLADNFAVRHSDMCPGAPGNWDHLIQQTGMFGFLGLPRHIVIELKGMSNSHAGPAMTEANWRIQIDTMSTWQRTRGSRSLA